MPGEMVLSCTAALKFFVLLLLNESKSKERNVPYRKIIQGT